MIRIGDSCQTKIADLQIAGRVQQQVRWLEVAMQDIGGVDVLQAAEDLVQEVADVVVAQTLETN
jgi:hypothetical protein